MMQLTRRNLFAGAAAAGAVLAWSKTILSPATAAAPVAGKQNAGWYRYKVGDFEVTVVTDGANTNPLSDAYVANAKKDAVNKELEAQFMEKDKAFQTYTPVVVNTGSKLVAIDTGLGLGLYTQSKGAVGQYHSNLQAANGLVGPENKPAFPNAEIMVPETEWAFWADESNTSKLPEVARGQMGNVKRVFGVVGSKVTKYQAGKELVAGITSIASPGHTPGHHSHVIASGNGKLLVQADITAGMANLFVRNPDWQFVFDTDKAVAVATRKKLYDMAAAEKMMVQGFHFPFPSRGYVEKSGNGYRLVPAPWSPSI
jgi:glyoxylase-like metal-dependent hydrolase (beta-lactamase superfamily II)